MAKERMINTKFWIDGYISNLDPIEKLLYLYLLTNPNSTIAGVYEVPVKSIAVDTGLDKEMVIKILARFENDDKVLYKNGWVAIKNFTKHQKDNPKINRGIELILQASPDWVIPYIYPTHRLSHSNSNSNTNTNSKIEEETSSSKEVSLIIKAFEVINPAVKNYYGNKTQRKACEDLIKSYGGDRIITIIEKTLPKSNTLPYFPSIVTPVQLRDKFAALENAINKYKSKETMDQKKAGPMYW